MRRELIFILLIFSLLFPSTLYAQEESQTPSANIVIPESIFVRSGPGFEFIPVGALYAGDQVTPVNISADQQWILITYRRGFGWLQRNLVLWSDLAALNMLPVLDANITPTARFPETSTPFFPSATPEGNYVQVTDAQSAYVRGGPGRTYLRLGQLLPGDMVEPVGQTVDGAWILIRFQDDLGFDGFGWIARTLVRWQDEEALLDLPVLDESSLTPTLTFTPSLTPSSTNTATNTPTSTATSSATASATASLTPTLTDTATATSTSTSTATDTATATSTTTSTATDTATATSTSTSTATDTATATSTTTSTATDTATATSTSTSTATDTVTATSTTTSTATDTVTATSTTTSTATDTATATSTSTDEIPSTSVAAAVREDTTPESTADTAASTTSPEETEQVIILPETDIPSETPPAVLDSTQNPPDTGSDTARFPIEAAAAAVLIILILAYIWMYLHGLASANLYKNGFVIQQCPVCQQGQLHVESRSTRFFGIPGAKRTVRCDVCRSVLRETSNRRWRYAVDRIENTEMYDRFNGTEITDNDLERLGKMHMIRKIRPSGHAEEADSNADET